MQSLRNPRRLAGLGVLGAMVMFSQSAAFAIEKVQLAVEVEQPASQWVVQQRGVDSTSLRSLPSVAEVAAAPYLADTFIVDFKLATDRAAVAKQFPNATILEPLVERQFYSRFAPNDTLFGSQWHLNNTGQSGGTAGEDFNVVEVWGTGSYNGYTGSGVTIGIIDDGLQHTHPDLNPNYNATLSYDYNGSDSDPSPSSADAHGTSVAGVAGARGNNAAGVSGVAPLATLAGIRLTAAGVTDSTQATALKHQYQSIDVYNSSWGPSDNGVLAGPASLSKAALEEAATNGRGGLGSIHVWAAGNGLGSRDNVNYDGYANSRHTIAVSAIDHNGVQSSYSEPGAPIIVASYSSNPGIVTTDLMGADGYNGLGDNNYTNRFGGTSSAAPAAAGVVALMLQANPNLTYRDVQHILVNTARKNHASDGDWTLNGAGHDVNHKYGFGAIDAGAAVNAALSWTSVADEISITSGTSIVNAAIEDKPGDAPFGDPVYATISITQNIRIEWVELLFNATHTYRGDLELVLTAPSGTQSVLAEVHNDSNDNFNWVYTSARHWDEESLGDWTLRVRDGAGVDVGTFNSWSLSFFGTEIPLNNEIPEPTSLTMLLTAALAIGRRSSR